MKALTFSEAMKIEDLPLTPIPIPEWNGSVMVRTLRAKEKMELLLLWEKQKDGKTIRIQTLKRTLANPDGSDFLADDLACAAMMEKNNKVVERLFDASLDLNRVDSEKVEELEKN